MSNLDECIRKANESGMSYGKYMNESFDPAAVSPAVEEEDEDLAKIGTKVCEWCGKEFPVYDKRKHKYCSKACQIKAGSMKAKQRREAAQMEDKKEAKMGAKMGAEMGAEMGAKMGAEMGAEMGAKMGAEMGAETAQERTNAAEGTGKKEDVRIRFAVMILENAEQAGTEEAFKISVRNALDILKDEGTGNE